MKFVAVLLLAAVAYGARYEKATTRIPGSYLLKAKDSVSLDGFIATFEDQFREGRVNNKWYNLNTIAISLPDALAKKLLELDAVDYVEEDGVFYTQAVGSWGLDRIDQRNLPLDNSYTQPRSGSDISVYVIDTGINLSHNEFGNRASCHWDYATLGDCDDCNGHGTHVAGTIGGYTFGVCQDCLLKAVRVLGCSGSGSTSNVVAGVNSIIEYGSVGSMSLGGGVSRTLDNAVTDAVNRGVTMSVAAGNDNADACNYSPARVPEAITVGSTDSSDRRSWFSNYGPCLTLFAPGSDITSAWHTSDSATNTISGTSMACPHVSGAAALMLRAGASPDNVKSVIVSAATPGVVINPGPGSPNLLLFVE